MEASNLGKSFGNARVVANLNFTLSLGQAVGLLGENGAGKTTTFRMLAGILAPSQGRVTFQGYDLQDAPKSLFKGIGYLPENAQLYPEMTPREYMLFREELKGLRVPQRQTALERVSSATGITDMLQRRIGQLSKGYRQRVALADALLAEPQLLLLDEPTAGLDPNQVLEFRALIQNLRKDHALLISTHILEEVEATCEYAFVLSQGKMMASGSLESLRAAEDTEKVTITTRNSDGISQLSLPLPELDHALRELQAKGAVVLSVTEEKSPLHQIFHRLTHGKSS